eukprot:COSAG06_NODE_27492_length_592_cov_0.896552_1_plen_151_part_01
MEKFSRLVPSYSIYDRIAFFSRGLGPCCLTVMDRLPPCEWWRGSILKNANTNPDTLRICEPVGGQPPINAGRFLTYPDSFPTTISRNPPCFICIIATWPRFRIGGAKRSRTVREARRARAELHANARSFLRRTDGPETCLGTAQRRRPLGA